MQAIQQMEAGKIYLIESTASANSVYFESDAIAKLFFRYCDYYLKDYLQVEEYILNKDGWAMLIKVRSAQTIQKYYYKDCGQNQSKSVWWILSERVRLFISTYVRMSNKILGREGSLVRRKYGRYQFENLEAAKDYVAKIRNNKHELKQSQEKYRGLKEHFQLSGTILTNPLRSSLWLETCDVKEQVYSKLNKIFEFETPILKGLGDLVAQKIKISKPTIVPPHPKRQKP